MPSPATAGTATAAEPVRPAEIAGSILESWIAADPASLHLLQEIRGIAASTSSVLIRGESGTGKGLLAEIIHYLGPHPEAPLVKIDCTELPRELLEIELFGCETIDGRPKIGRLELAGTGTIVFDEFAALSMPMQAKLLRVIDEKRFERVGGMRSINVEARVVALTAVDLEHALARRGIREDLYYRLNVLTVLLPPLRDRRGDIGPLAEFFLARLCELHRKPRLAFSQAAISTLENHPLPGNVRELRSMVERAVVHATPPEIMPQDLAPQLRISISDERRLSLEQVEREHIGNVLQFTNGRKTQAAQILGISRKTLLEKRKRYGLQ